MCGIYGYSLAKVPTSTEGWNAVGTFMDELAWAMDRRGGDSWGIVHKQPGMDIQVTRGLGNIRQSDASARFAPLVMAHTRFATVGAVHVGNAHPFQFGRIVGSHNGGIWNSDDREIELNTDYEVDSMALIDAIAREDTNGLSGYGAVHWMDMSDGSAYVCRMSSGELSSRMLRTPCGARILVWASNFNSVIVNSGVELLRMPTLSEGRVYRIEGPRLIKTQSKIILDSYSYSGKKWYEYKEERSIGGGYACNADSAADSEPSYPKALKTGSSADEPKESSSESAIVIPAKVSGLDEDWTVYPHEIEYGWAKAWLEATETGEDPYEAAQAVIDEEASRNIDSIGIDDNTGAIMLPNWSDFDEEE